eukprot:1158926-Pelagomonas_calceolata.AAC.7
MKLCFSAPVLCSHHHAQGRAGPAHAGPRRLPIDCGRWLCLRALGVQLRGHAAAGAPVRAPVSMHYACTVCVMCTRASLPGVSHALRPACDTKYASASTNMPACLHF